MIKASSKDFNTHLSKKLLSVIFLAILSCIFFINLLNPDIEISQRENRHLQQRPRLTFSSLLDGSFSKKFEEYISDQFFLRDAWVAGKTTTQLLLGRRDNNGVYYGAGGRLYEIHSHSEDILKKNIDALKKFAAGTGIPITLLPAPSASYIQPNALPKNISPSREAELWKEVKKSLPSLQIIPTIERLEKHSREYLYYYSDHHWTTLGAYYAYSSLMEGWNMPVRSKSEYFVWEASGDFLGALHSKSGYRFVKKDSLTIFDPQIEVTVEYPASGRKTTSLFEASKLATKDKYSVFMDGNHPLVTVKSSHGEGKLLVIKDSFAHSLIPLMAGEFEEIHIIDLRYFKGSVSTYIQDNSISQVLAVYSASSLGNQPYISQLR